MVEFSTMYWTCPRCEVDFAVLVLHGVDRGEIPVSFTTAAIVDYCPFCGRELEQTKMGKIEQIIKDIPNPYPEDIFTPIDSATLRKIHELLQEKMGIPLDRVSGEIGRRVVEAFREEVVRRIKMYLDEE